MNRGFSKLQLIIRTILYYRNDCITTAIAVAVCSMVITGALVIGDSVQHSLEIISSASLGSVKTLATAHGSGITLASITKLKSKMCRELAPALTTNGYLSLPDGNRSSDVSLYGIDDSFFNLTATAKENLPELKPYEIILNRSLASRLKAEVNDCVVLRYFKHSKMPGDAPFSLSSNNLKTVKLKVSAVIESSAGGNFDPHVSQKLPLNGFVEIKFLGDLLELPGRANLIISKLDKGLTEELAGALTLEDYGLKLEKAENILELRSDTVFMPDSLEQAIDKLGIPAKKVFGYFVNTFQVGNATVPYSFIAGIEEAPLVEDCTNNDIIINKWLSDQLNASVGDEITLSAFVPGPYGTLSEKSYKFRVKRIVLLEGAALNRSFMPRFPGMENAQSCNDWDPDMPIDLKRIRPVDEKYWDTYGGLPKAFVRLDKAREIWGTRFGSLTLVRFNKQSLEDVGRALLKALSPANMGIIERNLFSEKVSGTSKTVDFTGLFIGLGFFIILAALLLSSLLFGLHLEKRQIELTIMQIVGFNRRKIAQHLFVESGIIAATGSAIGVWLGVLYAWTILQLLQTVWNDAVNITKINLFINYYSLFAGFLLSIGVCTITFAITLKKFFNASKADILSQETEITQMPQVNPLIPIFFLLLTFILILLSHDKSGEMMSVLFFSAGLSMLICTTQFAACLLAKFSRGSGILSINMLAIKNSVRKFSRSMAVIRVISCAMFLVLAVSANHQGSSSNSHKQDSGTGGFPLYCETALPIIGNINSEQGRFSLKLDALAKNVGLVQIPLIDGSDASCQNLNRVSRPTVLGIDPETLTNRFVFQSATTGLEKNWRLLNHDFGEPFVIPAIADEDVIRWNLGMTLGDELKIESSQGQIFRLKFIAGLAGSIFQGKILISQENFYRLWPDAKGCRLFLIDTPTDAEEPARTVLSTALQRYGCQIENTSERLAEFSRVQNTYLSIFLVLGAIGLLLGCGGLAALLYRNMLERKSELEYLRILGFPKKMVDSLLFREHSLLLSAGILSGLLSAAIAVFPVVNSPEGHLPIFELLVVTITLTISGFAAIFILPLKTTPFGDDQGQ
ncbi:MAG: ABC transporter permease [Candidatus Riflebacteria bacterium]|nr:ABC transporter permease [Candidatus Riflebacteria bacterium]